MRTFEQVQERLALYKGVECIYHDWGYIAWQVSSGENVEEILFEVAEKGNGHGILLWKELCQKLIATGLPYHSVFLFHLASRPEPDRFYSRLGFSRHEIPDLYRDDVAVLRVMPFATLRARLGV